MMVTRRNAAALLAASAEAGSMTTIASATKPIPASMVSPTPTTVSSGRWMPRRTTSRCSATGMITALNSSAIAAVT